MLPTSRSVNPPCFPVTSDGQGWVDRELRVSVQENWCSPLLSWFVFENLGHLQQNPFGISIWHSGFMVHKQFLLLFLTRKRGDMAKPRFSNVPRRKPTFLCLSLFLSHIADHSSAGINTFPFISLSLCDNNKIMMGSMESVDCLTTPSVWHFNLPPNSFSYV